MATRTKSSFFISALILLLHSCSGPVNPEFQRMEEVKFKAATLQGDIILTAKAIFNNPNNIGLDLNKMDIEVYVDEVAIANVVQDISMKMAANSDFSLPIEVRIPIVKVFEDTKGGFFKNLLKSRKAKVRMEGDINASIAGISANIPFEYEDEYELKVGIQ